MEIQVPINYEQKAKITVFGVGGGGGNAIQHMIANGLSDVTFVAANTDVQALALSNAENKIQLGPQCTKGLGAGARPEVGRNAAEESEKEILKFLENTEMVFITAGMGGGTGTGAAPVIARLAKEKGILTIGVVTKPFSLLEGKRMKTALEGIEELRQYVDSLITIPNDRLLSMAPKNAKAKDMFMRANDVLLSAVRGVTGVIFSEGIVNLDFADIKSVMSVRGTALMGEGIASGENRALEATRQAIHSPLLEDLSIAGAKSILIYLTGYDISLEEYNLIGTYIQEAATADGNESPEVFFGMGEDESLGEDIRVTVIATGVDSNFSISGKSNPSHTMAQTNTPTRSKRALVRQPYMGNPEDFEYPFAAQQTKHNPGAENFIFSAESDMDDVPAFVLKQAN